MNQNVAAVGDTWPDKLDMSLDDIIKLNKQQRNVKKVVPLKGKQALNGSLQFKMQQKRSSSWHGIPQRFGTAVNRQVPVGKRRGSGPWRRRFQGVITGLAARKALMLRKWISPINRSSLSQKAGQRSRAPLQSSTAVMRQNEGQWRCMPTLMHSMQLKRRNPVQTNSFRTPAKMQQNKEVRQATFLFKRGLKVHMQTEQGVNGAATKKRTQPWISNSSATTFDQGRVPVTSGGILTVSIQNPSAKNTDSQPFRIRRPPLVMPFAVKKEIDEKKEPPKGVPLEFDINSVGKQTGITLNERFAILKERRTAETPSKGGRFVTVG
ncbi:UAP56-interacting factor-like isoform X2 [Mustelus asterias]